MASNLLAKTAEALGLYSGTRAVSRAGGEDEAKQEMVYYREVDRASVTMEKTIDGLQLVYRFDEVKYKGIRQSEIKELRAENPELQPDDMFYDALNQCFDSYSYGENFNKQENKVFGIRKGKTVMELSEKECDTLNIRNPFGYATVYM